MELHKYESYEEYKRIQEEGNIRKINKCSINEDMIKYFSNYILKNIKNLSFGICHGTRRGCEQEFFKKYLNIEVIGTEISKTATQFPNTIQWDFHAVKKEWINNVDFIFSNSFDHSYDPELALTNWLSCLKKNGLCFIVHNRNDLKATELDPFGADKYEYVELIRKIGILHGVIFRGRGRRAFVIKRKD